MSGGPGPGGGAGSTTDRIRRLLGERLDPTRLELHDQSAAHAGHPGAAAGGGHFRIVIVSARFEGRPLVERHRMVYAALAEMMGKQIHALSMSTLTPGESDSSG